MEDQPSGWLAEMTYPSRALSELESRYPGFSSFKTDAPVHYPRRWHRDALIQATLDRAVTRIAPVSRHERCSAEPHAFTFLLSRGESQSIVVVTDNGAILPLPYSAEQWPRSQLGIEPRLTTGRTIWRHKHIVSSVAELLFLQQALLDGPQTIMALMSLLDCSRDEKAAKLMSLIANGIFEIEPNMGLRPDSSVWLGPVSQLAKRHVPSSSYVGQFRDPAALREIAHARHSGAGIKNSRLMEKAGGSLKDADEIRAGIQVLTAGSS